MSLCFYAFPKHRGYVVLITTIITAAILVFEVEPQYRILLWSVAIPVTPLILAVLFYAVVTSTKNYSLSFAIGTAASVIIIWLIAAVVISYEMGYSSANSKALANTETSQNNAAYMKLQNDFDEYKANSAKASEEHLHTLHELQKRLDEADTLRANLEADLAAQAKIHSDDIISLNNVMHNLFFVYTTNKSQRNEYYKRTLNMMQDYAAKGIVEASFLAGYILDPRQNRVSVAGIKQDADKAIPYYETAAKHGHVKAQHMLGNLYYAFKKDTVQAIKYYKLAAENGDKDAQEALRRLNSK